MICQRQPIFHRSFHVYTGVFISEDDFLAEIKSAHATTAKISGSRKVYVSSDTKKESASSSEKKWKTQPSNMLQVSSAMGSRPRPTSVSSVDQLKFSQQNATPIKKNALGGNAGADKNWMRMKSALMAQTALQGSRK